MDPSLEQFGAPELRAHQGQRCVKQKEHRHINGNCCWTASGHVENISCMSTNHMFLEQVAMGLARISI